MIIFAVKKQWKQRKTKKKKQKKRRKSTVYAFTVLLQKMTFSWVIGLIIGAVFSLEENVVKPIYVADKSWEGGFQGQSSQKRL